MKFNLQQQTQGIDQKFDRCCELLESIQYLINNLQHKKQAKSAPQFQHFSISPFPALTTPDSINPEPHHHQISPENHKQNFSHVFLAKYEAYNISGSELKIPSPKKSQPILHEIHEKNSHPNSSANQQGNPTPQNTTIHTPNNLESLSSFQKNSEERYLPMQTLPPIEVFDLPRDGENELVKEHTSELIEAPKPLEQFFELGPNSRDLESEDPFCLGSFHEERKMMRRPCFVIDQGRRTHSKGGLKRTSMRLRGGLEEAWSRRPSTHATRHRSRYRQFDTEKSHNGGREKARSRQISRRSRRSEAWAHRIWKHGGGSRIPTEIMRGIRGYGGAVKSGRRKEAWSRRLPKISSRRVFWSRRTMKGRFWFLLARISAMKKYHHRGRARAQIRRLNRTSKELGRSFLADATSTTQGKNRGGRETAKIRRNPRCYGRFDAWYRRIASRYDGQRKRPGVRWISDLWEERQNSRSFVFEKTHNIGREVPCSHWIYKNGGRSEAWSRRIAKAQSRRRRIMKVRDREIIGILWVAMDDSGSGSVILEKCVGLVSFSYGLTILTIYGLTLCGSWSFYWALVLFMIFGSLIIISFGPSQLGLENGSSIEKKINFAGLSYLKLRSVAILLSLAFRKLKIGPIIAKKHGLSLSCQDFTFEPLEIWEREPMDAIPTFSMYESRGRDSFEKGVLSCTRYIETWAEKKTEWVENYRASEGNGLRRFMKLLLA